MRVAIVGAGTVGTRLALRCATHGCATTLVVRDRVRADRALERAAAEINAPDHTVTVTERLDALRDAELVAEAIVEDLDAKRTLFAEIEAQLADDVPIASATSTFVPALLGARLARPGRLVVAHMVHPVTLVPIVELLAHEEADARALATVERWLATIAMRPIRLRVAVPGFVLNRLQSALLREAASLVEAGVVEGDELDAIVELALGPRWAATGPLASAELGGRRTFAAIAAQLTPTLDVRDGIPLLTGEAPLRALDERDRERAIAERRRIYEAIEAVRGGLRRGGSPGPTPPAWDPNA
jgi:3-hydroxybutyryl-CoA dehydrogenase